MEIILLLINAMDYSQFTGLSLRFVHLETSFFFFTKFSPLLGVLLTSCTIFILVKTEKEVFIVVHCVVVLCTSRECFVIVSQNKNLIIILNVVLFFFFCLCYNIL